LHLNDDQLKSLALTEIEKILCRNGKTLGDYPSLQVPESINLNDFHNKLIQDELNYNKESLAIEHTELLSSLTTEQRHVYDRIIDAVFENNGGVFFVYGYGGTGKTYLWRTLTSGLRSKGDIVLTVASSGIASLLLPGGRTAHSRFGIPLSITEDSTCNITQGSPLAELLIKTKLIIWDEAPMVHRFCFEALDRNLRDVLRFSNPNSLNQPFGGKVVVFGGDFRQILPVIPKGNRADIVFATINSSYLWDSCQ
ncbi:ATP-dependent DNA helicase PIF4-like, partial [Asparagus officinalis]|uniref:ATP-dependent DNA helicase PIF4-like n=1 Tax=Asparagus officinalis TaxID=4686 RepID=UPI00098E0E6E